MLQCLERLHVPELGRTLRSCSSDGRPIAGVVFVGGFSYADVMDSAKGWAGTIKHNPGLEQQFAEFYSRCAECMYPSIAVVIMCREHLLLHNDSREDTWSLGVCNGCQLMALLGWVPGTAQTTTGRLSDVQQPRFIHNRSNRFESRWSLVTIKQSPAVMLKVCSAGRLYPIAVF